MAGPALVIFDCDGVLVDSEALSAAGLIAALAHEGVRIDLAYFAQNCLGRAFPTVRARIEADFAIALSDNLETRYREALLARFAQELTPIPHVAQAIRELDMPYHLATSSAPDRLARSLEITGLSALFEGRASTASEVARGKPAPDLFEHVAKRYGARPQDCLVIEDSVVGIRAARAAGMPVWRFIGGAHLSHLARGDMTDPEILANPEILADPEILAGADLAFSDFSRFKALLATFSAPAPHS